jgi:hypothetical protein
MLIETDAWWHARETYKWQAHARSRDTKTDALHEVLLTGKESTIDAAEAAAEEAKRLLEAIMPMLERRDCGTVGFVLGAGRETSVSIRGVKFGCDELTIDAPLGVEVR